MFVFVHFMWYDTWEQPRHVRIGSRSCNLMLLGQMLPRALTTNPVSESGNVVAAFLMFWSDAARMVAASIVLFPGMHLNLSRSHSHDLMIFSLKKKDHIHGRLRTFPQGACEQSLFRMVPNGDVVWNFTHAKMVSVMYACVWIATLPFRQQKSQSFFPNPWQTWIHLLNRLKVWWVIIDSAIPAIHQHFLDSRSLCQRWNLEAVSLSE